MTPPNNKSNTNIMLEITPNRRISTEFGSINFEIKILQIDICKAVNARLSAVDDDAFNESKSTSLGDSNLNENDNNLFLFLI